MSNRYKIAALLLALAIMAVPGSIRAGGRIDFRSAMGRGLDPKRTSIVVADASNGQIIAAYQPDLKLNPASCAKIITAASALSALGPDHRFHTRFLSEGPPDENGRIKTLYASGNGDPMLVSEDLWRMARNLNDLGLKRVSGGIVIDDSFFDSHYYPGRPGAQTRAYAAKTSAVAVNFNAVTIRIAPGRRAGAPAAVAIEPPADYFNLVNKAVTGGSSQINITLKPGQGQDTIVVSGRVPSRMKSKLYYKRVSDPLAYAGSLIRLVLSQNGIVVDGKIRRGRVPAGTVEILSAPSKPLAVLVRNMNKFSNNFIAEQILKHLGAVRYGRPGSTAKGLTAVAHYLESIGIPRESYELENGSGLSDRTKLSARQLVRVLVAAFGDFAMRPEFVTSLPIAGVDGTARDFGPAPNVRGLARAKTGTLGGVSSLAGYVPTANGRIAAFAILSNGLKRGADEARRSQMKIVRIISEISL
jgi:D-alanyl-D-alanine carboxypeptidase/D-alanyl-D-alanine-endopeptidase (penicillin-binding protein 4)